MNPRFIIDNPTKIGGAAAYVGFTGGPGGQPATQDILTCIFAANAAQAPDAPSGLGAIPATGGSVKLTWTNNANNQSGFRLDRATNNDFTNGLITLNLPGSPNTYTDNAPG